MRRVVRIAAEVMAIALITASCSATVPEDAAIQVTTNRQPTTTQTKPVPEPTVSSVAEPPERPANAWSVHTLDRHAPESDSYSIAGEDGAVIVVSASNSRVTAKRADESGESVAIPDATSPGHLAFLHGTLTMVTDRGAASPMVWQSENGTQWNRLTQVTWALPGEQVSVGTIHAVSNRLLAGGSIGYVSDVGAEEPRSAPAIWTSSDGATWLQSEIEVVGRFGRVSDIADVDGALLSVGVMDGRGAMWRSLDDGRAWTRHEIIVDGPPAGDRVISDLAVLGDLVVGVGESTTEASLQLTGNRDPMIIWSLDAGLSWTQAQFSAWVELEIRDFNPPIGLQISELVDTGDGIAIVDSLDQLVVYTWPSVDAPPQREPFNLAVLEIPIVRSQSNLEVGVTYRYPLSSYCGIKILRDFNSTFWSLSSGEEYVDETWPWVHASQVIYGFMTLVDETTIKFHPTPDPNVRATSIDQHATSTKFITESRTLRRD